VFSPYDTILAHLCAAQSSTNGSVDQPPTRKKLSDVNNGTYTPTETSSTLAPIQSSVNMASVVMSKKLRIGTGLGKDASFILDCFRGVTVLQPCWNKWIVSDVWVDIINAHHDPPDDLKFTSKELNAAVARNPQHQSNLTETMSMAKPMGLCKSWFKRRTTEGKQAKIVAHHATSPNALPTASPSGSKLKWCYDLLSLPSRKTRSTSRKEKQGGKRCLPVEGSKSAPTQNKSKQEVIIRNGATGRAMKKAPETQETNQSSASESPPFISWWDSTNAFSLFGEQVDEDDKDAKDNEDAWNVKAMVEKRIERLRRRHTTVGGWKVTLDDLDTRDVCSAHDISMFKLNATTCV
jgi:hypothetical protein